MRRLVLVIVLAAMFAPAASAQADTLSDARDWALKWESTACRSWNMWADMYLAYSSREYVFRVYGAPDDDEDDPTVWAAFGLSMKRDSERYRMRAQRLWERIIHPNRDTVMAWKPLARWVCIVDPQCSYATADAYPLLRQLRREYGPHPRLVDPLATMRRISRQWFSDHKHLTDAPR